VSDTGGQRQQRDQAGYTPRLGPADLLSDDARAYTDAVPGKQAAAANDETLNGTDAVRRLRGND
jgi:hypothetical protein